MKKYIYFSLCVVSLVMMSLSSCRKLDEYNPSGSTAEAIWSTPEGMLTLVNATYSDLRNFYGKEDAVLMTEGGTDIWFNADKANYVNQFTRYEALTPSLGTNRNAFATFYKGLNLANAGINRIKDVVYTNAAEKNMREGEMRFNRAFYLWHIVEFYGGANLRTTETQGPQLTAQRSSVDEFYKVIIEDLEFARQHLPITWGAAAASEVSRVTKKAAMGLLARAYLSRGYYSTGTEAQDYFTKARDVAKEVIDRRAEFQVRLWPNYADLWLPANNRRVGREANGEALYFISNSSVNTGANFDANANRMHLWYLMQYSGKLTNALVQSFEYGLDNQRRLMPTLALLDMYNEDIDSRYEGSFQEVWLENFTSGNPAVPTNYTWTQADANRYFKHPSVVGKVVRYGIDTIMYVTKRSVPDKALRPYLVFDRDSTYNASTTRTIRGANNFVALKKFHYPTRSALNAQPGYNDIFLIRLAEMYLIAAEAEFKLGNPGQAATYVNVLRTRAAKPGQVAAMQITSGQITTDFLLDERAREFAGEQLRWFDLKRMLTGDQFVQRIKTLNPDITAVQPFHRLRPIPQEELDALVNGKEFGQNPGY
jgi:hypothetical protein